MKWRIFLLALIGAILLIAASCEGNKNGNCEDCPEDDLISGAYNPTPYNLEVPTWMPKPFIPADNPLTKEGIALGRMLFYDPILSSDGSMSCASCHQQEKAFTDGQPKSAGVLGMLGKRSSMSLANLAFNTSGLFWDGRSTTLEEQALLPVEDHIELNENWSNVEEKLRKHENYPTLFRQAFGIDKKSQITRNLAVKAIAQFERTLVSGNSKYDRVVWLNEGWFTDEEERGRQLFFFEPTYPNHPGCSHCHFNPLFTDNNFHNNGLDAVPNLDAFADAGRGAVTKNRFDNGKFRVPTLRNIELTAPYMHDGRFQTLEEVLDQYASGGHGVENENPNIIAFPLTVQQKQDLIAFLKALTDTSFVNNPSFSKPF